MRNSRKRGGFVTMIVMLVIILVIVIGFAYLRVLKANQ